MQTPLLTLGTLAFIACLSISTMVYITHSLFLPTPLNTDYKINPNHSIETIQQPLAIGGSGPVMVNIPGGTFRMGDLSGNGSADEQPIRSVTIAPFKFSQYEITVGQFQAFVTATSYQSESERDSGCVGRVNGKLRASKQFNFKTPGFEQTLDHPVTCISFNDANAYVKWLTEQTGSTYRLPSEAEWEYAARAGTTTAYSWGNQTESNQAACNGCDSPWDNKSSAPVGSFKPNGFGLYDMHGNVWEWVEDAWHDTYENAPTDGRAWLEQPTLVNLGGKENQLAHILRGGSWYDHPGYMRAANRFRYYPSFRSHYTGFRVVKDD